MFTGSDDNSCSKAPSRLLFRPWEGDNSVVQSGAVDEGDQRLFTEWQHPMFQFLCGIFACSNFRTGESQITKFLWSQAEFRSKRLKIAFHVQGNVLCVC